MKGGGGWSLMTIYYIVWYSLLQYSVLNFIYYKELNYMNSFLSRGISVFIEIIFIT